MSKNNLKAYRQLKTLIESNHFDIIHCQSPIGGVLTRIAARKQNKLNTRIIYTAHGFHFFKGAHFFNWITYYPIEKVLSYYTDTIITINEEDYSRAKKLGKSHGIDFVNTELKGRSPNLSYADIIIDEETNTVKLPNGLIAKSVSYYEDTDTYRAVFDKEDCLTDENDVLNIMKEQKKTYALSVTPKTI